MLQSSSLPRFGTTIAQGTNVIDSEWWELSAILDLMMFDWRTADMQVQNSLSEARRYYRICTKRQYAYSGLV